MSYSEFRVVISGNSGDGFTYTIKEVIQGEIVENEPCITTSSSLDALKKRLNRMQEALDRPIFTRLTNE